MRAGSAQFSRNTPLLSISLLLLWILTFLLANIKISENAITFQFIDLHTVDDLVVTLYVGSISIGLISLSIQPVLYGAQSRPCNISFASCSWRYPRNCSKHRGKVTRNLAILVVNSRKLIS